MIAGGRNAPKPRCGDIARAQERAHGVAYCLALVLIEHHREVFARADDFAAHGDASNG
jgi:hypothetical protein